MDLTLTSAELARIEEALQALLHPLDHGSLDSWRLEVNERFKRLLEADAALFVITAPAVQQPTCSSEYTESDFNEYLRWFPVDEGTRRATEAGLDVFTQTLVVAGDWKGYHADPAVNEFYKPRCALDGAGYLVNWPDQATCAVLELHRHRSGTELFDEKGRAILRLLLPAFKAGLISYLRLAEARTQFARCIDQLGQAILLVDLTGTTLHQTPPLERLIAQAPATLTIQEEIRSVVNTLTARYTANEKAVVPTSLPCPVLREIRTDHAHYRAHGVYVGSGILGARPMIAVSVERLTPEPLSDIALSARYALTPREIQVARLIAQGQSNRAIARALSISIHTAERHAEHVLTKFRVGSRAAVRAKLLSSANG